MKIALGCDHTAFEMKNHIQAHLEKRGYSVCVFAPEEGCAASDYPIYAERAARAVSSGECDAGILICGTGIGMSLAANKVPGIRAACVSEPYSAKLAKEHNNAQIICFGARVVGKEAAVMITDMWLDASYDAGRHAKRVAMIDGIQ